eukprot:TRINITY_DN725_c0_g1_i7.p1 TRINITY_DN725_c0_g1~~TRINITY_DN725_c0_g1_i7.p1  ORF type:complete len:216 (-),score=32.12 TRINITY_DN725_c0_g1_i7:55-702(-)
MLLQSNRCCCTDAALVQEISKTLNMTVKKWDGPFDCLQTHICHNYTIPPGVSQSLYDQVVRDHLWGDQSLLNFLDSISGSTYAQIAMGSFVSDVLSRIDAVVSGGSSEKLAVFSGHDTTLSPLTAAFGVDEDMTPPYASLMRIEVVDAGSDGGLMIQAFYNNNLLTLPGCSGFLCSFTEFKQLSQSLIILSHLRCNSVKHVSKTTRHPFERYRRP